MTGLRIAACIVFAAGLATLAAGLLLLRNRLGELQNWKPVEALVTRAWVTEKRGEESSSYAANYELSYSVDGRTISAVAKSEDPMLMGPEQVQLRLARHAAGTRGVIRVSPDDASRVALNRGMNGATLGLPLWLVLSGTFLLMIAVSLWLMGTPGVS